ncbi:hypothetical protein GCM10010304_79220 [Streptomyces roseoviolaceus]
MARPTGALREGGPPSVPGQNRYGLLRRRRYQAVPQRRLHEQEHPARTQQGGRLPADPVDDQPPVTARVPGTGRAARLPVARRRRHVRRIGQDQIERLSAHGIEEVAVPDAEGESRQPGVQPRGPHGGPGHVNSGHPETAARGLESQGAGPGAHVEDLRARGQRLVGQGAGQQLGVVLRGVDARGCQWIHAARVPRPSGGMGHLRSKRRIQ